MADCRHVGRSVAGSQPHEVVMEDDIHDPGEAVFDAPVGAHGMGEVFGGEFCGG